MKRVTYLATKRHDITNYTATSCCNALQQEILTQFRSSISNYDAEYFKVKNKVTKSRDL